MNNRQSFTEATPPAQKAGEAAVATAAAPAAVAAPQDEAGGEAEEDGGGGGGEEAERGGGGDDGGGGGGELQAAKPQVERMAVPSLHSAARPVSVANQTQCCGKLKVRFQGQEIGGLTTRP